MSEVRLGQSPKKLDLSVVEHGVTKEAPMAPGVHFTVLPWATYNPRYRRALEKRAIRDRVNGKAPSDEESEREFILRRAEDPEFIVDAVLADIEGLLNEAGNAVSYTRERGVQILSDPAWTHLREWIVGEAYRAANIYEDGVANAGNGSGPDSRGKKGGAGRSKRTKS